MWELIESSFTIHHRIDIITHPPLRHRNIHCIVCETRRTQVTWNKGCFYGTTRNHRMLNCNRRLISSDTGNKQPLKERWELTPVNLSGRALFTVLPTSLFCVLLCWVIHDVVMRQHGGVSAVFNSGVSWSERARRTYAKALSFKWSTRNINSNTIITCTYFHMCAFTVYWSINKSKTTAALKGDDSRWFEHC